jgi:hypothetical protein
MPFQVLLFHDCPLNLRFHVLVLHIHFIGFLLISEFGKESSISLANLEAKDVLKQVERLSQSY